MPAIESGLTRNQHEQAIYACTDHGCSAGHHPTVMTDIYDSDKHIAVWNRNLSDSLEDSVARFIDANPHYKTSIAVTPENAYASVKASLGNFDATELCEDIAELVDMFCMLFALERAGLRLIVLNTAMCPKFHVDRIPCRLVTTYQGVATQWLPQERVNRSKLGHGSGGMTDDRSGLFENNGDIQQLKTGDVALLKGDLWEGNEGRGLVHRSPAVTRNEHRLLLTLDFMS